MTCFLAVSLRFDGCQHSIDHSVKCQSQMLNDGYILTIEEEREGLQLSMHLIQTDFGQLCWKQLIWEKNNQWEHFGRWKLKQRWKHFDIGNSLAWSASDLPALTNIIWIWSIWTKTKSHIWTIHMKHKTRRFTQFHIQQYLTIPILLPWHSIE
jgi:hypothetical protein